MSSCRLVRVFCKKENNQKVKALREELELKDTVIEEKDNKLNTLLQYPFSVIKLLATQYFNLRRSIEEPSNVRTRQFTEEQAAAVAKAAKAAKAAAKKAAAAHHKYCNIRSSSRPQILQHPILHQRSTCPFGALWAYPGTHRFVF